MASLLRTALRVAGGITRSSAKSLDLYSPTTSCQFGPHCRLKVSGIQTVPCTANRFFSTDSTDDDLKFGGVYDPEDMTPPIPPYVEKQGETMELKRARLLYQSRKRGMLENGLLLSTFAGKYLNSLSEEQLTAYDKLINQPTNDWEIYYWVTEAKETPDEFKSDVMDLLKKHAKNEEKDASRIRQPDLH